MIVISSSLVALIVAAFVIDTTGASTQRWKSVKKTTVVGFFAQDLAETNETTFDYVRVNSVQLRTYFLSFECFPGADFGKITSNFGLLDRFRIPGLDERGLGVSLEERNDRDQDDDRRGAPWKEFEQAIEKLNRRSPKNTAYKVLYLARHGEGFHVSLIPRQRLLSELAWAMADLSFRTLLVPKN